ncbi:MAG: hypothetical protein JW795_12220, partial [Chitinivibrionales bacterium]|nr:hypothetical protein [Chitinivibrionales bacterium]
MRMSASCIPTMKEVPGDTSSDSLTLLLRSGMMRCIAAGLYTYLPLGCRVLRKIETIIRSEMERDQAQEFQFPPLYPAEIVTSPRAVAGQRERYFTTTERDYCITPQFEACATMAAKGLIASYRDLPQCWYQMQTTMRNEDRPRQGSVYSRSSTILEAITFTSSPEAAEKSIARQTELFRRIFDRCGITALTSRAYQTGLEDAFSQAFFTAAENGQDMAVCCSKCTTMTPHSYATSHVVTPPRDSVSHPIQTIATPGVSSIDQLCAFLKIDENSCAKTRVYVHQDKTIMVLMRGNDAVNEAKLAALIGADLRPAQPQELSALTGCDAGSIGPIGFAGRIIADKRLTNANNLYSGANTNGYHVGGIDLVRDVPGVEYGDLQTVRHGQPCVQCAQPLSLVPITYLGWITQGLTLGGQRRGGVS